MNSIIKYSYANPRQQFIETNATSHALQHISDSKISLECFRGPHAARGSVVEPHWARATINALLWCSNKSAQRCLNFDCNICSMCLMLLMFVFFLLFFIDPAAFCKTFWSFPNVTDWRTFVFRANAKFISVFAENGFQLGRLFCSMVIWNFKDKLRWNISYGVQLRPSWLMQHYLHLVMQNAFQQAVIMVTLSFLRHW